MAAACIAAAPAALAIPVSDARSSLSPCSELRNSVHFTRRSPSVPSLVVKAEAAKTTEAQQKESQQKESQKTAPAASQNGGSEVAVQSRKSQDGQVAPAGGRGRGARLARRESSPLSSLDLWDPFVPASWRLGRLVDLMDQFFDDGGVLTDPFRGFPSAGRVPWDTIEDDESFKLRIEMPGFSKDEVKVAVEDDAVLMIKAEHKEEDEKKDEWAGRSYGRYETRVELPEDVEVEQIKAEYKDGVLYITIPKKKNAAKKVIDVDVK